MLFTQESFLFLFLPLLIAIYYLLSSIDVRVKNIILLLFSLLFYGWGKSEYIVLLLAEIIIAWIISARISKISEEKEKSKLVLIIGIASVLGVLIYFKYADFLILNVNAITKSEISLTNNELPLGISFFSFQVISFMIDCYRGDVKKKASFMDVALYVAMFPQLVAGPIVRYTDIEKQLHDRTVTLDNLWAGIRRFSIGFAKKVIIANQMAFIAQYAMDGVSKYASMTLWLGSIAYTLQIYFDFSGYSDMAIGLGKIFGFDFPENFNDPYTASTVTDFWRRWHMSLSGWFRDYVYIPLGGSRKGNVVTIRNLFIVWALTGIWHGANWTFVLWGLLYFVFLAIEKWLKLTKIDNILSHIYTLFVVNILWIIFNSTSVNSAWTYIRNMFDIFNKGLVDYSTIFIIRQWWLTYILAVVMCLPKLRLAIIRRTNDSSVARIIFNAVECGVVIVTFSYVIKGSYNPFIYFNF